MSGKSALQWISDIAMTFARQYLERSEMSIKEIACRMEFPDQSSFGLMTSTIQPKMTI